MKKNDKPKKKRKLTVFKLVLPLLLIYLLSSTFLIFGGYFGMIFDVLGDMKESVETVARSYYKDNESEQQITESFMKTFRSEVSVIDHILADYDIQNYTEAERLEAVDSIKMIRERSSSRELYICDADGNLFLASGKDWLDVNIVERGIFTAEQLKELTDEADRPESLKDAAGEEIVTINFNDSHGYSFCRRILDSQDVPTDYYLVVVYDDGLINEGINTWIDKTTFARAVSEKDPMVEMLVLENGTPLFQTPGVEEFDIFSFADGVSAVLEELVNSGEYGNWGEMTGWNSENPSKENLYLAAYQASLVRPNGQEYVIIAALDLEKTLLPYRFGAGLGSYMFLFILLVLLTIYCLYAARSIKNKKNFLWITSGLAAVMLVLFIGASTYFQSIQDVTMSAYSADSVFNQIDGLYASRKERQQKLTDYYKVSDMTKLGLVAYDVEYSGRKLNEAPVRKTYYETDGNGNSIPRLDSLGNKLVCSVGVGILKDKTDILSDADIWIINDSGFAIASSCEENWSLNTNKLEESAQIRSVMYGETPNISLYHGEDDESEGTGSTLIYPVTLYAYSDGNGNTVYMSAREYEKAVKKYQAGNTSIPEPKALMGVLLIKTQKESDALAMARTELMNNLSSIVSASDCNYAEFMYDDAAGETMGLLSQIHGKDDGLELEQIRVPAGIKKNPVFNFFQNISGKKCYIRARKDVSNRQLRTLVFTNDVVHENRPGRIRYYGWVAFFTLLLFYLVLLQNGKKAYNNLQENKEEASEGDKSESAQAAKSKENSLRKLIGKVKGKGNSLNITRRALIRMLIYLVVIVGVFALVRDLFLSDVSSGKGIFVNIYSSEWQHCVNAYNLAAMFILLGVVIVTFSFIKNLVNLFCVPLGRKVETYAKLAFSVVQYVLVFLAIFYGAYLLGMELKSLGTFATVVAGVIGIGSQQLINDVGSGVAMLSEGRYIIGDLVSVDGFTGVIREMGVRNCILVNEEGVEKSVSNGRMGSAMLLKKNVAIPQRKDQEDDAAKEDAADKENAVDKKIQ